VNVSRCGGTEPLSNRGRWEGLEGDGGSAGRFAERGLRAAPRPFRRSTPWTFSNRRRQRREVVLQGPHKQKPLWRDQDTLAKQIAEHPLALGSTAIVAFFAIVYFFNDSSREPAISFEGVADTSWPLASPFTVTNRSSFFSMYDVKTHCSISNYFTAKGSKIDDVTLTGQTVSIIQPGQPASFRCLVGGYGTNALYSIDPNPTAAHVLINVEYETLWFTRQSPATEFIWSTEANPPTWARGPLSR
jgi:hypothetical protein